MTSADGGWCGRTRRRLSGAASGRWQTLADLVKLMPRGDRWRVAAVTAMSLAIAGGAAATGLSQRWLVDNALHGSAAGVVAAIALGAVAHTLVAGCGRIESNLRLYLIERFGILLNREIVAWSARIPTIEHLDDPRFLDRSSLLRDSAWYLAGGLSALAEVTIVASGSLLSVWLLVDVSPVLGVLILLAVPPLLANMAGLRRVREARERVAGSIRTEQRLHDLAMNPASAKEILVSGAGRMLGTRADSLWRDAWRTEAKASLTAAVWQVLGWVTYIAGLVVALAIVSRMVIDGTASVGDAVLVLSLGTQLLMQLNLAIHAAQRVALAGHATDYYQALRKRALRPPPGDRPAPTTLRRGITLRDVSFGYGDGRDAVLRNLDVHLPAAATVAVVGVNGAGKSTFVKLLCGMYQPTSGQIEVDGLPLHELAPESWRSRLSAAFQDSVQFQVRAGEAVRIGDLNEPDERAVPAAVDRAGATEIIQQLPDGYRTQLGTMFGGVDLSGGQWQRLAVARASMRSDPLLLLLDEPTASMDPEAEHQLFEQFIRMAGDTASRSGTITLLVTHRYSTVRDADLVIVLDDGRIVERGRHEELIALGGRYAHLYSLQAKGYR